MERKQSILTDGPVENLFKIEHFPVSLTCVPVDFEKDIFMNMEFSICKETGIVFLKNVPPLEEIYIFPHNESLGKKWTDFFDILEEKVSIVLIETKNPKVLEIGGGSLLLSSKILEKNKNISRYDVYEKNLISKENKKKEINLVDEYFTEKTELDFSPDITLHSHVLEHVSDPVQFIKNISETNTKYHVFGLPNLKEWFKNKYSNAINFEHNILITEDYIDVILKNNNFDIIDKHYYLDHSIIYTTKKVQREKMLFEYPNLYLYHKKLALELESYYLNLVEELNTKLVSLESNNIYLFGGHIFSQFLISFGLKINKVVSILDNSKVKNKRRLYGTKLFIEFPSVIKGMKDVYVIVKAGSYQKEIKNQLVKINCGVTILE